MKYVSFPLSKAKAMWQSNVFKFYFQVIKSKTLLCVMSKRFQCSSRLRKIRDIDV